MKPNKLVIRGTKKRSPISLMIWDAGYGLKDFATAYGCTVPTVCQVVNGAIRSEGLETLIATTLGHTRESLFPPSKRRKDKVAA